MVTTPQIPVIDLFAGPGGLGEGFSTLKARGGRLPFRVRLSIEKERRAHTTLQLRSFLRSFGTTYPAEYYEALRAPAHPLECRLEQLYNAHPRQAELAEAEAWQAELGTIEHSEVFSRIHRALGDHETWVLLGGPPCQAYSIAGRSRNKGLVGYSPERDIRHYLYMEYLQVIADHRPAVFVMENVKGLLSATVKNKRIFHRILEDLVNPKAALVRDGRVTRSRGVHRPLPQYEILPLVRPSHLNGDSPSSFVVEMEKYGIPQARHRLILLGVRKDLLGCVTPGILKQADPVPAMAVLKGLPRLRSGLSREHDTNDAWLNSVSDAQSRRWYAATAQRAGQATQDEMQRVIDTLRAPGDGRGSDFVRFDATVRHKPRWYLDKKLGGVINHSTRGHIVKDLHRYLYCACYGRCNGRSPVLADFPRDLLPDHRNVEDALDNRMFADRFRVQLADKPATTITSHISKDGHYYIHPDPTQCRSLTVREAARLQTFPDNYFFCGPRTSQYGQVGNAVPPLLAKQIAGIVLQFLTDTGAAD